MKINEKNKTKKLHGNENKAPPSSPAMAASKTHCIVFRKTKQKNTTVPSSLSLLSDEFHGVNETYFDHFKLLSNRGHYGLTHASKKAISKKKKLLALDVLPVSFTDASESFNYLLTVIWLNINM